VPLPGTHLWADRFDGSLEGYILEARGEDFAPPATEWSGKAGSGAWRRRTPAITLSRRVDLRRSIVFARAAGSGATSPFTLASAKVGSPPEPAIAQGEPEGTQEG
jgi:hypothetical protein